MPLEFIGNAICLSGLTGTKLKCDIIGAYYPFWWGITSGGQSRDYSFPTAIVELNAATGEVYIEDIKRTVLGSAGHAIDLKVRHAPNTFNLKVILVEEDTECYTHLKRVIERRWPQVSINEAEGPIHQNSSNIYLLNETLPQALATIDELGLGNSLYFFDPLRSVQFSTIEGSAIRRVKTFYRAGTEFLIFVFTSDWFLGRDEFAPLPCSSKESDWTDDEYETVMEADFLLGDTRWRSHILNNSPVENKGRMLVKLYQERLHKWFRYVLPMPFCPDIGETFHLVLCSNYSTGVRATRDFYCNRTRNPRHKPDIRSALQRFQSLYPNLFRGLPGNRRPLEWRILWRVIREHEEGICDSKCKGLRSMERNRAKLERTLDWLENREYLTRLNSGHIWKDSTIQYIINWPVVQRDLGVTSPPELAPLPPED